MDDKQRLMFIIMQMQTKIYKIDSDLIDNSDIDDIFKYFLYQLDECGRIIYNME